MTDAVITKLPDYVLQSFEESNKPMSLDEIREKFGAKFPFKAKKISGFGMGEIYTLIGTAVGGGSLDCPSCNARWKNIPRGGYIADKCSCSTVGPNWCPDSKAWVYQG